MVDCPEGFNVEDGPLLAARRYPDFSIGASGWTFSMSSNAVFTAAAGRLTAPLEAGRFTAPELTLPQAATGRRTFCPHLGQRYLYDLGPSSEWASPLDWHDGQITVLATTPSR